MREWLKERLKSVLGDLVDTALENKVSVIAFLSPVIATATAYLLSLYQTSRKILLSELMKEPVTLQMWNVLAFLVFLLSGVGLGLIISKFRKKHDYLFIDGIEVKWKSFSDFASVEETPYCKKHQIKLLLFGDFFRCPECQDFKVKADKVLEIDHQVAQNKAEAIIGNHYKGRA